MSKMQRLLVAVDFSDVTNHAIDAAIMVASRFEAKITLMHAYHVPPLPYGGPFAWPVDEVREAAQDRLEALVEETRAKYSNCDGLLDGGEPRERIVAAAKETHADLIVVGTHGRRAVARFMLGSVAEKVVRHAPVPVLTVPPRLAGGQEPASIHTVS